MARIDKVSTQNTAQRFIIVALRLALVLTLFGAGWSVYHRLPRDEKSAFHRATESRPTILHIILRRASDAGADGSASVQIDSVDIAAAKREFSSERRAGLRFDDFLSRRRQGRAPILARFDEQGQATVAVPPGFWWVNATLSGAEEITWHLRISVEGREQTVELTPENAYTRTKSF